jgi:photosystem II stability/assembly factor-like uncharacterized protein
MKNQLVSVASLLAASLLAFGCVHTQQAALPAPTARGPVEFKWVQVPLRSAAQKAKGYAGGEAGQAAYSIAICPTDPNFLAIAIDGAAVYISNDGARSWHLKRNGILTSDALSVAFDPRNPRILWAACMNGSAPNPQAEGIYLSVDGGDNWRRVRAAAYHRPQVQQAQNEYFAFDPGSFDGVCHRTVYAATHDQGLLKTTDGGSTWKSLGFSNTIINAVILHPQNARRLFLATQTGLSRSDDAGESFSRMGGSWPDSTPILGLAVSARDPDLLYVAIGVQGIWRSTDGGRTFTPRMNGIPPWAAEQKWSWSRLCISPANPLHLYADAQWGGAFPYWSHDGGASWSPASWREPTFYDTDPSNPNHWSPEGFVAHPTNPDIAYHVTPVRKTTDGGKTWVYASDGVSGCRRNYHTSVAFSPDDPRKMIFFHGDYGSALTRDGGDTFTLCSPPRQWELGGYEMPVGACDPTPGSRKVISAIGGSSQESGKQRICISTNDCRSWQVLKGTEGNYQFLAFHPQQPKVVYAGRATDSLRSRDGGKTWTALPYPIKSLFPGNGDIVYAARQNDANGWDWTMLRSSDQGDTWQPLPGRMTGGFNDVDVDPANPNRLYAATSSGVWVFDGTGWSLRDERHGLSKSVFGGLCFGSIAVDPTRPEVIYAGQNEAWKGIARGIFRSTDRGNSWKNISLNLGPDLTVWAITVSPHDGTVWLATDYGNWKLPPGPYAESSASQ